MVFGGRGSVGYLFFLRVNIPASVPLKEFDYNAEEENVGPMADTVVTVTFKVIETDDVVLKNRNVQPAGN